MYFIFGILLSYGILWLLFRWISYVEDRAWTLGHEEGWDACLHEWNEQDKLPNRGRSLHKEYDLQSSKQHQNQENDEYKS